MSDTNTTPPSNPDNSNACKSSCKGRRRGRGALFVVGVLLAGGLIGSFATKAISHGHGYGHGWHGSRGPMGHMGGMHGSIDPQKMEKRAARMAKHISVAVDATDEQTAKLVAIAKSVALDAAPLRSEIRTTRRAVVDMLTSENFDRATLEKLRGEQVTRWDGVSKRLSEAVAEASEVLTAEQRTVLRERVKTWREARHGWGRHKRGSDHE